MKRHGFLFEKAFSQENLYLAYLDASKGKHKKRACYEFEQRLAHNLTTLYVELWSETYQPRPHYNFIVCDPKRRLIYAPAFRDLVVQHAIYRVVYDIFNRGFIDQSFACRKGKGTHAAADYAQHALQNVSSDSYTLKLDIRKFFYRIDRIILRRLIEKKIKDKQFVAIMMMFTEHGQELGIPIGNLLSQLYALIYMNPVDHFVKRTLKVKYYCRYVDDFVLFGLTREQCLDYRNQIEKFIHDELSLNYSKTTIGRINKGINFVGYRTWASKRFIRKHSLYKFRKSAKKGKLESVISILGHARNTHSRSHLQQFLLENHNELYHRLPKICQFRNHS